MQFARSRGVLGVLVVLCGIISCQNEPVSLFPGFGTENYNVTVATSAVPKTFVILHNDANFFISIVVFILEGDAELMITAPGAIAGSLPTWTVASTQSFRSQSQRSCVKTIAPGDEFFATGFYNISVRVVQNRQLPQMKYGIYNVAAFSGAVLADGVGIPGKVFSHIVSPTENYAFKATNPDRGMQIQLNVTSGDADFFVFNPLFSFVWSSYAPGTELLSIPNTDPYFEVGGYYIINVLTDDSGHSIPYSTYKIGVLNAELYFSDTTESAGSYAETSGIIVFVIIIVSCSLFLVFLFWRCRRRGETPMTFTMQPEESADAPPQQPVPFFVVYPPEGFDQEEQPLNPTDGDPNSEGEGEPESEEVPKSLTFFSGLN